MIKQGFDSAYFGLVFRGGLDDGEWCWEHDTSSYFNWDEYEPNNNGGNEFNGMFYGSSKWNDGHFGIVNSFICEWDYEDAKLVSDVNIEDSTSDTYNYNSHRYQVVNRPMSWSEARNYCEQLGGYLATITSSEEQAFIKEIIELNNHSDIYWLGATDEKKEEQWEWITGEEFSYENWCVRAPDNFYHEQCGYENYLGILGKDFSWWGDSNKAFKWNDFADATSDGENSFSPGLICEWDDERGATSIGKEFKLRYTFNLDSSRTEYVKLSKDYNPDQFTDATAYSPKLARTLSIIAASAYTKDDVEYNLKSMGFSRIDSQNYYIDPVDERYENDSCGFSFGEKELPNGEKMVMIAIRGSYSNGESIGEMLKHENSDWTSNLNVYLGPHFGKIVNDGFNTAMKKVYESLIQYLGSINKEDNTVYMITGHSRGAGIGNLLATKLMDAGVSKNVVFNYNFACPDVAKEYNFNKKDKYSNIFNIGVQGDIVPLIPGTTGDSIASGASGGFSSLRIWGKYGQSYWFSLDWNQENSLKDFNNHAAENYVEHMAKEYSLNKAKNLKQLRKSTNTSLVSILVQCPVDVEVIDTRTSNVVVTVVNNEVKFNSEAESNLIVMSWTEDDEKNISILGNSNYVVNLTGSDEGTMDCFVTVSSADSAITDSVVYYKDVNLYNGKSMALEINEKENKYAEEMVVQNDDTHSSELVKPTFFKPVSLYGDTNLNNEISVDDAQLTLKAYTERIAGNGLNLTTEQIIAADINGDGEISVDDAQNILIYYVNNTVSGKILTWDELLKD